jgi:hypothetical protein
MKTKTSATVIFLALFAVLASLYLTSCTTIQRQALLADSKHVLGKLAVAELQALVASELGDKDFAHAAAAGAWSAVDAGDVAQFINDATGDRAPQLADAAATAAYDAVKNGTDTRTAVNAVASAISAAAFAK